jgi:hypothetical protein
VVEETVTFTGTSLPSGVLYWASPLSAAYEKTATPRVAVAAMTGTSFGSEFTPGSLGVSSPVPRRFTDPAGTVSSRNWSAK